VVIQAYQTSRVEALQPRPHGDGRQLELLCNGWNTVPLVSKEDDARAFDSSGCRRA
jgi:hypothetical protein